MMKDDVILKVENLSKQYRLGLVGTGTISHDFNRFLARIRGKEDPYLKIGESNDRSTKGTSEYVWALKDINFEVKRGEILGIIGKNGAGKSTLLKILSKVTGPTTGAIKSKGRIASLLEVGTGFHPEMTGKENIFLNGTILGMTKKEIASKLDEIIEFSGCERYVETPVKRYSSGMKVRLAFAVAAFLEPDILVVDEVLAVGDAEFQKKAIGKMQDISSQGGRTVLFVSHDMAAVKNLCSRLLVLGMGKDEYKGDVEEGIDLYLEDSIKNQNFNLLSIKQRNGNRKAMFKSISLSYIMNEKLYEKVKSVKSGCSKFFIDITICSDNNFGREIDLAIGISDSRNIPVCNISNEFTKDKLLLTDKETTIRYEIDSFNLRAMSYNITLWGKFKHDSVFDNLQNQINFDVLETDFFNSGNLPRRSQHGYLLLKNKAYVL